MKEKTRSSSVHPGSFRDPDGFLFYQEGRLYRQINQGYQRDYELLIGSGLYDALVNTGLLIPHAEARLSGPDREHSYKVIQPVHVPFVSYPYEWCFSQLKHAALATLQIQKIALKFGMSLKDASAYNIQFFAGKPTLIDTLSFEERREGEPWVAYRQFCQHFLAPLALMAHTDIRLGQWFRVHIDGVPLDFASKLLPLKTRLKMALLAHLHLHARSQRHFSDKAIDVRRFKISARSLLGLVDHLQAAVESLAWKPRDTEWKDYYNFTGYSDEMFDAKKRIVGDFVRRIKPGSVWDLGANTGIFSRIASNSGIFTVAFDVDPAAVEMNYLECVANSEGSLLPLVLDLTNPSPAIGWSLEERSSLLDRGPADLVLALALLHHLAISNNVPLASIAQFFSRLGRSLAVEFVPKEDPQVQKLLATRRDIFLGYKRDGFEAEFSKHFRIVEVREIPGSLRTLYLMNGL